MQSLIKNGLSLKTQIYGLLILLALVSFGGKLYFSVQHSKTYFQEQMSSHAQDAATSLGLSISPYMDEDNLVIADTMVSAIFDSGYYASIVFKNPKQEVIFERQNPAQFSDVPDWFVRFINLDAPIKTSEVNNGWNIAGTLFVQSHTGVAYQKMWDYLLQSVLGSLVVLALCMLIAYYILKSVFKPLSVLEEQATLVSRKQFSINPIQPFTKELRKVTSAMNKMITNLETTFLNLNEQSERLNKEVYQDPLTGLGNRKAFENYYNNIKAQLSDKDTSTLCMVTLPSLQSVNNELGYQDGDSYVLSAVKKVQDALGQLPEHRVFRLAGGTLVVLLNYPGFAVDDALASLNTHNRNIDGRYKQGFLTLTSTEFNNTDDLSKLLSRLDTSNTVVQQNLPETTGSNSSYSVTKWREIIDSILHESEIEFSFQPVKFGNSKNHSEYYEVFSQLIFQGERISNIELFAMAERLGKNIELDKKLIKSFINIKEFHRTRTFALNLSRDSITDPNFIAWFEKLSLSHPILSYQLLFEVKESALVSDIDMARLHIDALKKLNIGVCIEHFGTSTASFKYLKGLDVEFVKLDASFTNDIQSNSQSEFFVSTVTNICKGFGIKVIGCQIESADAFNKMRQLGFDGFQGRYIQAVSNISVSTGENEFTSATKLLEC